MGPLTGPLMGPLTGPLTGPVTGPLTGPVTGPVTADVEERGLAPKLLTLLVDLVFLIKTARLIATVALGLYDVRR